MNKYIPLYVEEVFMLANKTINMGSDLRYFDEPCVLAFRRTSMQSLRGPVQIAADMSSGYDAADGPYCPPLKFKGLIDTERKAQDSDYHCLLNVNKEEGVPWLVLVRKRSLTCTHVGGFAHVATMLPTPDDLPELCRIVTEAKTARRKPATAGYPDLPGMGAVSLALCETRSTQIIPNEHKNIIDFSTGRPV